MRGVNKVILIGSMGKDPEVRYLPSGGAVANITIATSESWKDKNTGAQQEQTEWHRVVFYGRLAEVVGEYARKGSKLYIEGSLHTRKWQDKQTNQDRYSTEIKGSTMQLLDSRPGANSAGPAAFDEQPPSPSSEQYQPTYGDFSNAPPMQPPVMPMDDDIPF